MDGVLQKAVRELTATQQKYIAKNFFGSGELPEDISEDRLEEIYDALCDIEVDETIKAGDCKLSREGKLASDIVTVIGNAIADANGYFDEDPE